MVQMRHKAAFRFCLTAFGTRTCPSVDVHPDKRDSNPPLPPVPDAKEPLRVSKAGRSPATGFQ